MFQLKKDGKTYMAEGVTAQGTVPEFIFLEVAKATNGAAYQSRKLELAKKAKQGSYWMLLEEETYRGVPRIVDMFLLKKSDPEYRRYEFPTGKPLAEYDPA